MTKHRDKPKPIHKPRQGVISRLGFITKGFRNEWLNDRTIDTRAIGFTDPRRSYFDDEDEGRKR